VAQLEQHAREVAALQERELIAGEIHDGIAQNLSYLYLQLDQLAADVNSSPPSAIQERLMRLQEVLDTTTSDVRQFIARLREVTPPPIPLGERLRAEVEQLARELTLQVDVTIAPPGDLVVPADISTELSWIVGEALRNAQRHGRAAHARIEVLRRNGHGCVCIRDDGIGFDPNQTPTDGRGHNGLDIIRARTARIGGTLAITSRLGDGARVEVYWPIAERT